jgi:hypothetical protein
MFMFRRGDHFDCTYPKHRRRRKWLEAADSVYPVKGRKEFCCSNAQTKEACNEKYNDHDADDVENIHLCTPVEAYASSNEVAGLQSKRSGTPVSSIFQFHIVGGTKQTFRRCPLGPWRSDLLSVVSGHSDLQLDPPLSPSGPF